MTKRTGVPSMIDVAQELCRLIVKFSPVIQNLYPDNGTLQAALATALAACAALDEQLQEVREIGT